MCHLKQEETTSKGKNDQGNLVLYFWGKSFYCTATWGLLASYLNPTQIGDASAS